jgi:serine-type D-Ala-D-Ala carboxypeptidase/endopeptidase
MQPIVCALALSSLAVAPLAALAEDPPPDPPPFAIHALGVVQTLRGAIASAERLNGKWEYALAGDAYPPGHAAVPPEKVLFEIGSISKVFTGLLLADAVVEGKLKLSDTLAARLPVKIMDPATGGITLQQLASHTSCLLRMQADPRTGDDADPYAGYDERALFAYLEGAKLDGHPPCESADSNLAFAILGVVLERTYQQPWAALVHAKITGPLGMADTVQELSAEQRARLAAPWEGDKPGHEWNCKAFAGAGGLHSTAGDLSKLADAILARSDGPLGKAWPILAGDYAADAFIGGKVGLALGHVIAYPKDPWGDSYTHGGVTGAYRSLLEVWPGKGRAIVVLADNSAANPVAWVSVWRFLGVMQAEREEIKLAPTTLDDYVGIYTISEQARLTVLRRGDRLAFRLTAQPFFPIFASARDEFFLRAVIFDLRFHRDGSGKVDRVTLVLRGRAIEAERSSAEPPRIEFPGVDRLTEYAGEYDFGKSKPGARLSVSVVGDTLYAMLTGQQWLPVFAMGKDEFDYDALPATLTFERNAAGKVVAVVLHQNGIDQRAPRL